MLDIWPRWIGRRRHVNEGVFATLSARDIELPAEVLNGFPTV